MPILHVPHEAALFGLDPTTFPYVSCEDAQAFVTEAALAADRVTARAHTPELTLPRQDGDALLHAFAVLPLAVELADRAPCDAAAIIPSLHTLRDAALVTSAVDEPFAIVAGPLLRVVSDQLSRHDHQADPVFYAASYWEEPGLALDLHARLADRRAAAAMAVAAWRAQDLLDPSQPARTALQSGRETASWLAVGAGLDAPALGAAVVEARVANARRVSQALGTRSTEHEALVRWREALEFALGETAWATGWIERTPESTIANTVVDAHARTLVELASVDDALLGEEGGLPLDELPADLERMAHVLDTESLATSLSPRRRWDLEVRYVWTAFASGHMPADTANLRIAGWVRDAPRSDAAMAICGILPNLDASHRLAAGSAAKLRSRFTCAPVKGDDTADEGE